MSRGPLNLLIDMLAGACLLTTVATGYVLRFPLPPGTNRTHELWGLSRHEWGAIHSWASLGLLLVLIIHFGLLDIISGKQPDMKAAAARRLAPDEIQLMRTWIASGANWATR